MSKPVPAANDVLTMPYPTSTVPERGRESSADAAERAGDGFPHALFIGGYPGRHEVFGSAGTFGAGGAPAMTRRLASLTLDLIDDLPDPCRSCVFWELDPVAKARAEASGDPGFEKEAWISEALLNWGSCGTLVYVDDLPAGYALYAPPTYVPRGTAFPTAPVSGDAVLLAAVRVVPEFGEGGLARMLVQGMVRDLARRGVRAVEAFGDAREREPASAATCVTPAAFLRAVGFKTVRPHPRWPRLRLDVKGAQTWRAEAEAALERILGGSLPVPSPEPAYRR